MPGHVIWGFIAAFYVAFVTCSLLVFSSPKTIGRNWFACVGLIVGMILSFMLGKST